ncbi:hypothetical protein ACHQM5_006836 [Ranunculus cassubicifolius]
MKDKGKGVAVSSSSSNCNWFSDYCSSSSDLPCKKHPSSSTVGICAYCLKDRLIKLVCSDCGEQRLSSCSCSDDISSSFPNSCSVDIGSVGRISFLIENDTDDVVSNCSKSSLKSTRFEQRSEGNVLLKRSSSTSTSIDVKKTGFWRFGRLFRKKKEKDFDEEGENRGVSRSRSLSSYRGKFFDLSRIGNADSSSEFKSVKKSSLFELSGSFRGGEDPDFIDLKLELSKPEFSTLNGGLSRCQSQSSEYSRGDGMFSNGTSCRITVDNNETKKCRKSFKVWKWIVKHHSSIAGRPSWKKDEQNDFKF